MTEQEIFDLKDEIEQAKSDMSEFKGQRKALLKQLKEVWECGGLNDAKNKSDQLQKEREKSIKRREKMIKELEEKYVNNE